MCSEHRLSIGVNLYWIFSPNALIQKKVNCRWSWHSWNTCCLGCTVRERLCRGLAAALVHGAPEKPNWRRTEDIYDVKSMTIKVNCRWSWLSWKTRWLGCTVRERLCRGWAAA